MSSALLPVSEPLSPADRQAVDGALLPGEAVRLRLATPGASGICVIADSSRPRREASRWSFLDGIGHSIALRCMAAFDPDGNKVEAVWQRPGGEP